MRRFKLVVAGPEGDRSEILRLARPLGWSPVASPNNPLALELETAGAEVETSSLEKGLHELEGKYPKCRFVILAR